MPAVVFVGAATVMLAYPLTEKAFRRIVAARRAELPTGVREAIGAGGEQPA